jgi:hypothetical protein
MQAMKNVKSKMSLAASKAWITRRANAASSSSLKNEKKNGKKKTVKESGIKTGADLKGIEAREMKALNGVELEQLAVETQKRLDRKLKMQEAKEGKKQDRGSIIGAVIQKAKIERFNGGVKVSGVQ